MALSRNWTVKAVWDEAQKDVRVEDRGDRFLEYDRDDMVHRVIEDVAGQFYGVFQQAYMTPVSVTQSSDVVDISSYAIMRGYEHKMILEDSTGGTLGEAAGVDSVTAGSNAITFTSALSNTNYIVFANVYDSGGASVGRGFNLTKTTLGFTLPDVVKAGTCEWFVHQLGQGTPSGSGAITAGNQTVTFATAASNATYVLLVNIYNSSGGQVGATISNRTTAGFDVNPVTDATIDYYAVVVSQTFPVGLIKNAGRVSVPGSGSAGITLSTTMSASSYVILPPSFYSAGGATLGYTLSSRSTSGWTVVNATATAGTFDYITLDSAQQSGGSLPATVKLFHPLTVEALHDFRVNAFQNKNRRAFAYNGEQLFIRKGYGVTSYGTLTLRYPRVPTKATSDSTKIDLPDGPAVELAIMALKARIRERLGLSRNGYEKEAAETAKKIYTSFGETSPPLEEIQNKVRALL